MPMRPIDLLDAKDLSKLSTALRELRQVEIYKTLGSLSVTARTLPGGKTRTVAMIVQVRTSRPGRDETVNCESMEQLQQLWERSEYDAGTSRSTHRGPPRPGG